MTPGRTVPVWIPAPGLQLSPVTADPRTDDRLNAAREWMAARRITGPLPVYGPGPGPGRDLCDPVRDLCAPGPGRT